MENSKTILPFIAYCISCVLWAVYRLAEGNFLPPGINSALLECVLIKPLIWLGPAAIVFLWEERRGESSIDRTFTCLFPWFPTFVGLCLTAVFLHTVHIFTVGIDTWGIFEPVQLAFSLSAAVTEELVFRGFLFKRQALTFGAKRAAALNGILFALYHFPEFFIGQNLSALVGFRFWMIAAAGFCFCLAFAKWKHLGMTIIIHFFWNTLSYIFGMA